MSAADPRIEQFLNDLKSEGRSSPASIYWHEFYEFLLSKNRPGQANPPVPLILAASVESDANKHKRLSNQLEWALENGCIDEALHYLETIPAENWNSCPLDRWHQESHDF